MLLLDEPLGALDLKLREQMQEELKALQKALGITFVFVTHDQGEALSMADRVAVFNDGRIMQVGTPEDIYQRPELALRRRFRRLVQRAAAGFRRALFGGSTRWASLRPEAIRIGRGNGRRRSPPRVVSLQLSRRTTQARPSMPTDSGSTPSCRPATALPAEGEAVMLTFNRDMLHLMDEPA